MQHRPGAIAALCAVVAMVAAACSGAEAVQPNRAGAGAAPRQAGGAEVLRQPGGADQREPEGPGAVDGGSRPQWELSPSWALHPELLQGSDRFRRLTRERAPEPGEPTNVVLITTDDMTAGELRWMPMTRALFARSGVSFSDSISPHPLCCPARAMTLTGQFAQNNGVRTNIWPTGGYYKLDHTNTLPVWMKTAGYETAFVGKYLNEYARRNPHEMPPGWDHWRSPANYGIYDYYNYTMNVDRELRKIQGTYLTDYYTGESERLIRQMSSDDQPFFLWQSHLAPHTACPEVDPDDECWRYPTTGLEHSGVFDHVRPPQLQDPSYNERDVSDKPHDIAAQEPLKAGERRYLTELFQRRIESLQSVDASVARTVDTLADAGELDNTLLMFTSDNGYLLGQHRASGKNLGYEPALRVPLLMRGPSVPSGVRRHQTVGTVDLAPTIAAAGGADPGLPVDGRNLLPVARGERPGWDTILIQAGPNGRGDGWLFRGVRTDRYTYMELRKSGETELYDRRRDPYQLRNVAGQPAYERVQAELRRRLLALQDCAGADCRQRFGPVPAPRTAG